MDERPEDPAERDTTAKEKFAHWDAVNDLVNKHRTAQWVILLGMKPRLQASHMDITQAGILRE